MQLLPLEQFNPTETIDHSPSYLVQLQNADINLEMVASLESPSTTAVPATLPLLIARAM